jgi:DNA topoisomerase-2
LILTEGLSAKTFAMHGRSIIGVQKYGISPLRGKVLNVRNATVSQMTNNVELTNLKKILGLVENKSYKTEKDFNTLRYGKVILLVDSDLDGKHICGLVINFFHALWPSLLERGFIQTIRTPIVKAISGKKVIEFFSEQDYLKWKSGPSFNKSCKIRYFKGLGTSTKEDAKNTFRNLEKLQINYYYKDKNCDNRILLAFDKDKSSITSKSPKTSQSCADSRKVWLQNYNKDSFIDSKQLNISFAEFIDLELIHFSIADNLRSIPNLYDGLKPCQRKIMYYLLKRTSNEIINVAQLSGYVAAEMKYHHGPVSLEEAIIKLGRNFTGSNNINLLVPEGNFGSRYLIKDAASSRYTFTKLEEITRVIYNNIDKPILNILEDDGHPVEPEYLVPIIPMVLVNGCEGIGTAYSTSIPSYNPKEIVSNLKKLIKNEPMVEMNPWFRNFKGKIVKVAEHKYTTHVY